MHSSEPEGLQPTYHDTEVEMIKEASAALGEAQHRLKLYSAVVSMYSGFYSGVFLCDKHFYF